MAWGAVAGAAVGVIGGALLSDGGAVASADQAAGLQAEIARDQWNQYKEIYQPLEKQYVGEAQNYDSDENYARAAGNAQATVSGQFSKAREQLTRTPGLDPSSAAYQAGMARLGLQEAASGATAQNLARKNVMDTAYARKTDALSLGKGLAATASTGLAQAANTSMGLANLQTQQASQQAGALGSLAGRAVNGWLGSGSASRPSEVSNTGIYNGGDMSTGSTFDW